MKARREETGKRCAGEKEGVPPKGGREGSWGWAAVWRATVVPERADFSDEPGFLPTSSGRAAPAAGVPVEKRPGFEESAPFVLPLRAPTDCDESYLRSLLMMATNCRKRKK
ncbi:hypothetical protein MRX96_028675 [Rhipicephalus microplus]